MSRIVLSFSNREEWSYSGREWRHDAVRESWVGGSSAAVGGEEGP